MLFWTIFKVAIKSLWGNKLRSFLAMLGIIIGVASVISMLAIATGAQQKIMKDFSSLSTNILNVRSENRGPSGVWLTNPKPLKIEDAQAIVKKIPEVFQVAPTTRGSAKLKYMNNSHDTTYIGTSNTYFSIRNFEIGKGRIFTDYESEGLSRVVVIGTEVWKKLFDGMDPLNENIKVKGINFRVIGVTKEKGDSGFMNPDDQIFIPYKTAMKQLSGQDYLRGIDIETDREKNLPQIEEATKKILRKQHRITEDSPDDFEVSNQAEAIRQVTTFTNTFTIILGCIGSIALLVGGIGIMNIMLVTVTERTREIGIRKAIGAKNRDILRQFLIESILMSSVGGIIGLLLSAAVAQLIGLITKFYPIIDIFSVLLAITFSMAVGIFFGYYPAHKAAKLNPIEALRYE